MRKRGRIRVYLRSVRVSLGTSSSLRFSADSAYRIVAVVSRAGAGSEIGSRAQRAYASIVAEGLPTVCAVQARARNVRGRVEEQARRQHAQHPLANPRVALVRSDLGAGAA